MVSIYGKNAQSYCGKSAKAYYSQAPHVIYRAGGEVLYGKKGQVHFKNESEYYYALGFLASGKRTDLRWEHNENQGAWGSEGRIHCYNDLNLFPQSFSITTGVGNVLGRINCNIYVAILVNEHGFTLGPVPQNISYIRSTVPPKYYLDFDNGVNA